MGTTTTPRCHTQVLSGREPSVEYFGITLPLLTRISSTELRRRRIGSMMIIMCFRPIGGYACSDQNYQSTPPKFHSLQSIGKIVCPGFACKTTAGARSDTHGLVRDFSGDHTKVFKVRLRRDNSSDVLLIAYQLAAKRSLLQYSPHDCSP